MVINFLASYGAFGGGAFGNMFASLQQSGFFDYVLPFLLIFAIVFAVLSKAKIFGDNKAISAIISLAVSLMSLQFRLVSTFFEQIFPQLGIGLVIILLAVILLKVFSKDVDSGTSKAVDWIIFIVAAIVFVVIVFNSLNISLFGFGGGFFYNVPWGSIIIGIVVIAAIVVIVKSTGNKQEGKK